MEKSARAAIVSCYELGRRSYDRRRRIIETPQMDHAAKRGTLLDEIGQQPDDIVGRGGIDSVRVGGVTLVRQPRTDGDDSFAALHELSAEAVAQTAGGSE